MASIVNPVLTASLSALDTVLISNKRSFGNRSFGYIFPDVVLEERHVDELTITDHPIEVASGGLGTVADHCYLEPAEVVMRVGWSPSSRNFLGTVTGGVSDIVQAARLRRLIGGGRFALRRQDRGHLSSTVGPAGEAGHVATNHREAGLRQHAHEAVDRDNRRRPENSLMVEVLFREVHIVATSVASLPRLSSQRNPQDTSSPTKTSPVQPDSAVRWRRWLLRVWPLGLWRRRRYWPRNDSNYRITFLSAGRI